MSGLCGEEHLADMDIGDEPKRNGRAVKVVLDTKRRVRVLLHAAGSGGPLP